MKRNPRGLLFVLCLLAVGCESDEGSTASATSATSATSAASNSTHCQLVHENEAVAKAALAFFRKEVGELDVKAQVDRIERCAGRWNVLISAGTESHPLNRLWYVGLTDPELKEVAIVPPE